ncbi:hypothetical protein N9W89_04645, partial [Hellea sp.]|nr:hypothetical protein [Hellea sp.]
EDGHYFYFVDFENVGGLITPLPLKLTYMNGDTEELMVPAEIWRRNSKHITKLITRKNRIKSIELDPHHQTADADFNNNSYPPVMRPGRLEMYKSDFQASNMMRDMLVELKTDEEEAAEEKGEAKDDDKDMPISGTDENEANPADESDTYSPDTSTDAKSKMEKDAASKNSSSKDSASKMKKKKLDEKEKSSLRKTLEKMMGK